jgi:S-adenosylmethionine:tRNA-ribosyltransferase-isomerase (queuine synthetase)
MIKSYAKIKKSLEIGRVLFKNNSKIIFFRLIKSKKKAPNFGAFFKNLFNNYLVKVIVKELFQVQGSPES